MASKSTKKGVSLKELQSAAEDLNKVLDLEPPIDVDQSEDDLKGEVIEIAQNDVAVSDKLSKATWATLEKMKVGPAVDEEPETEEETEPEAEEEEEEEAPKKSSKKAPEKKKVSAKKEPKEKKVSRADAFAKILKKKKNHERDELIKSMTEEYGGSEREAKNVISTFTAILKAMDVIEIDGSKIKVL